MEILDNEEILHEVATTPETKPVSAEKTSDLSVIEARLEKNLAAYHRLLKLAVKYTYPSDWVDSGGPYLLSTGAERIARPFGIYVRLFKDQPVREDREDAKGKYYIYSCRGVIGSRLLGAELEIIGTCSSRDKFFAMVRQGNQLVLKPLEDIDETNIRKKAYTNMFVNGITRLLGLRRLSWEFLAEAGINKEDIVRIEYGGKSAQETISESQAKMLYAKLKEKEMDHKLFFQEFGISKLTELPRNRMNDALAFIAAWKI